MIIRHLVLLLFVWTGLVLSAGLVFLPSSVSGLAPVAARAVEYPGSEGEMPAHLYVPDGDGRAPAVLVLHTVAGPGPNVEAFARELAGAGYVTMTPDVFSLHDFGPDGRTDHPLVLGDVRGALAWLGAQSP